jgi:methylthioribose-1-phosphate isomerase
VTTRESRSGSVGEASIGWADGALLAIDQRALPHELRWLRLTTVDDVIDAIKTLAIRGAPALGVAGAFGVALASYTHVGDTKQATSEAQRIASARPTAVNLAWGVRRALAALPAGPDAVLAEAWQMLSEDAEANRQCATHAADLVLRLCPDRPLRVLTHCNTGRLATTAFGTALGAVRVLHARGNLAEVLVDETRPLLQGARLTAWELAEAGIPHTGTAFRSSLSRPNQRATQRPRRGARSSSSGGPPPKSPTSAASPPPQTVPTCSTPPSMSLRRN